MPYIASVKRIGIKKGIEQGIQQGIQQGEALVLRRQLSRHFGALPPWMEGRLAQANVDITTGGGIPSDGEHLPEAEGAREL